MSDKNFNEKIQDAIDSQDYSELSKALQNLVTDTISSALGEIGDNVNKAADIIAGRTPIDRRPAYMKERSHKIEPAQRPWMSEFDRAAADYLRTKDLNEADIYSTAGLSRVKGYLFTIFGLAAAMGSGAAFLFFLLVGVILEEHLLPLQIFFAIATGVFGFLASRGFSILSKLRRFKKYIKAIGKKNKISIRELGAAGGKSEKDTVKDIKKMIDDNMFVQGKLDYTNQNLYVTEEAFKEYQDEIRRAEQIKAEDEIQRMLNLERLQKEKEETDALSPEVQKILTDGHSYIGMIKKSNDAIEDEVVSEKLENLEAMTTQIFSYIKEHPQAAAETKKLMKYYLPTTEKLLDSYQKLTEAEESGMHPDQIPNIQKSKREIEETLDTLNQAFARLFDNIYRDTSMDISADISVLNTLLAQEGLVGEDIRSAEVKKKEKQEEKGQVLQSH